jgi:hypothetical protein
MALNDIERKRVENTVGAFVEKHRPPAHLREQVDLAFRFDGKSVELFEIRPRWDTPTEIVEESVAKARYMKSRDEWLVYWQRADLKWHKYAPTPEVRDPLCRGSTEGSGLRFSTPRNSLMDQHIGRPFLDIRTGRELFI